MYKPHTPNTGERNKAEANTSASASSRGETMDKAKQEINETFKPGKDYDAEMEAKFGKEPSEQDIVAKFAGQEKFKGKGFQEILAQLEQDDNKPMADRLRKKLAGEGRSQHMNDKGEKEAMAAAGYTPDEAGIKPIDEKTKKKIETNKSADIKGFTLLGGEQLKTGDIVIGQEGGKSGNPIFRFNAEKKNYESINYKGADAGKARMQELKKLFKRHEVTEGDMKKEPEKKEEQKQEAPKIEAPKVEAKKSEPPKVETPKAEKKESKEGFFKRAARGTGKAIARPFKKSRQATKRTGKALGKTAKFAFNASKALVKSTVKTLFVRADLPGYRLEKRSFSKGTKAWTQGYKNHWTFKKKEVK